MTTTKLLLLIASCTALAVADITLYPTNTVCDNITAAVDVLGPDGGTINLAPGNYTGCATSADLGLHGANITIRGAGSDFTRLWADVACVFEVTDAVPKLIEGMTIHNTVGVLSSHAFALVTVTDVFVRGGVSGIVFSSLGDLTIHNCSVQDYYCSCASPQAVVVSHSSGNLVVTDTVFRNLGSYTQDVRIFNIVTNTYIDDCLFENTFERASVFFLGIGNTALLSVSNTNFVNTAQAATKYTIDLPFSHLEFTDCEFRGLLYVNGESGLMNLEYAESVRLTRVSVVDITNTVPSSYGILVYAELAGDLELTDVVVRNIACQSPLVSASEMAATLSRVAFTGCNITNVQTGSTILARGVHIADSTWEDISTANVNAYFIQAASELSITNTSFDGMILGGGLVLGSALTTPTKIHELTVRNAQGANRNFFVLSGVLAKTVSHVTFTNVATDFVVLDANTLFLSNFTLADSLCGGVCVTFEGFDGVMSDALISNVAHAGVDDNPDGAHRIVVTEFDFPVTNTQFVDVVTGTLISSTANVHLTNATIRDCEVYADGVTSIGTVLSGGFFVADSFVYTSSFYLLNVVGLLEVRDVVVLEAINRADYLFRVDTMQIHPPTSSEFTLYALNDVGGFVTMSGPGTSVLSHLYIDSNAQGGFKVHSSTVNTLIMEDSQFAGDSGFCISSAGETTVRSVVFETCATCISASGSYLNVSKVSVIGSHETAIVSAGYGLVFLTDIVSVGAAGMAVGFEANAMYTVTRANITSAQQCVEMDGGISATVADSAFVGCGDGTTSGPAVTVENMLVDFVRCSFDSNSGVQGGAVSVVSTTASFTSCNITNNAATSNGGAIYFLASVGVLVDVVMEGNEASGNGGAFATAGTVSITANNCVMSSNSAGVYGGAGYVSTDGQLSLFGCVAEDNAAAIGGGFYAEFASLNVTSCTLRSNTGTVAGAAVCVFTDATVALTTVEVVGSVGSAAVESVLGGSVNTTDSLFDGNEVALSLFATQPTILVTTAFVRQSDVVIDSAGSALVVDSCVFRANAGEGVIVVDDNDGSEIAVTDTFIAGNSGVGIGCTRATVRVADSTVCENDRGPVECGASGFIAGDYSCFSNNTDCLETCTAKDYCVPAGGYFTGPYEGCYECGGVCASGVGYSCVANSSCVDVESGPYGCQCNTGFEAVGSSGSSANLSACVDVDECVDVDVCTAGQRCVNTVGSFNCECETGWVEAGSGCVDVDECCEGGSGSSSSSSCSASHNCGSGAVCSNTAGSFVCECPENMYGDGVTNCTACPTNSTSSAGSALTEGDCECIDNHFRLGGVNDTGPCLPCPAGYQLFYVPSACVPCAVGSYKTTAGPGLCTACPEGRTTFVAGAADISDCDCDVGTVSSSEDPEAECVVSCLPGQYALGEACVECDIGSYTNSSGSIVCETCPAHTTTAGPGATNITACVCEPGFYRLDNTLGQGCQRRCPPGMKQESADSCTTCPSNSYSDAVNAERCEPCPPNAVSPDNSSDVSYCRCPPGYYSQSLEYGTGCVECPAEARCKGGRSAPVARKGFHPVGGVGEFAECVPRSACAAGGECAEGYTGELCAACDTGYFRLDGKCRPCNNAPGLVMFLFFACLLAVCAGLVWFNARERAVNSFVSVAIGLNSLQITAMYGRLDVNWPEAAQKFFDALSLFNFNIELFAPECSAPGASAFWMRWSLAMFMPVFAAFNFAIVFGVGSALSSAGAGLIDSTPRDLAWSCGRALAQLLTIVYLPLAATVLEYFDCVTDGAGRLVLATSRDTLCYDATYWRFIVLALLGVLAYVVGIPAALGSAFVHSKRALGEVEFAIRFGFFVGRYDENYYWYEMVILARKFGMALAFSFLFSTGYFEAGAGLVVLLGFYVLHSSLKPYRTRVYNALESVCVATSLGVLLISLTFQAVEAHQTVRGVGIVLMLCMNVLAIVLGVVYDAYVFVTGGMLAKGV